MRRRILSIITALALCLSLCPTWALAVEGEPDTGLCDHHPEHIGCGYAAPTEGRPCGHQHTAECYTKGVLPDADGGDYYEIGADTENLLDCRRSHDSECGYVESDPGAPCGYACRICPIEALIAALPEQVTEDNAEVVRVQLDHILDLYRELNEDEQEEIDLSRVTELQGALDNANAPMMADGRTERLDTDEASVTINGETLYYATLEEAFAAANGQTATITMLTDAECIKSDSKGSPLNITGGTVTLDMNGKTLSGQGCGYYGIINVGGGSLSVRGQGTVTVFDTGLTCYKGTLTVDGIIFNLTGDGNWEANSGVHNQGGFVTLNNVKMSGASEGQVYHYSGNTTINNVTTTDSQGTQYGSTYCGVYYVGDSGTLTINGGTFDKIVVNSGNYGGVQSVAGLLGQGYTYKKQESTWATADEMAGWEISNVTVEKIPLTINPNGDTSWYYSTQQTHTLEMNAAPVDSGNSVSYAWKNGEEALDCTSDAYTVPAGTPVGSYNYTCEATCDGYTLSHTFTFKIEKSGTEFTGGIKTYNGSEETTSFTAGDTIKVVAAPTPTGTAPTNSAMFAASFTPPTTGQMAVFVGDTQVSVPADKGEDGSYTMTVSATDVLTLGGVEPNGDPITLTAKFVGNGNMADGQGTAAVNITAVAKAERDNAVIGYYGAGNLDKAFAQDSGNAEADIILLADVARTENLQIEINCTLDLGGHIIHFTGGAALGISGDVTATIQDQSQGHQGQVISEQSNALVVNGSVTLEGGTFTSHAENCAGVKTLSAGAQLIVTNEHVVMQNTSNGGYGLIVTDAQSVRLSAGTYSGGMAAIATADITLGSMLAHSGDTRYAYFDESGTNPIAGVLSNKSLTGTVTVKACQHTGEGVCTYTHNENTSTHTKTCLACGNTWAVEDCDYGEYTHNDTSHTRICKLCGYQNVEAHNIKCTAEASGTVIAVSEACKTCGYGKDLGTVTIHIPKLVYGDLTGVVTAENTLTEPVAVAGNVKNPLGETIIFSDHVIIDPPTMDTLTGNALLSAGEHKIKINIVIIRDENALAECELTFNVDPAPLTPSITGTATKPYDGTTDVASGQLSITLTGVVGSDDVTAAATSYAYDNTNAGENKTITASGITLKGDSKDNYTLSSTTATTTGTITKSQPTIAFAGGYDPGKTYDGQTISNPTADDLTITGAAFRDVTFTWYAGNVDEANKLTNPPRDAGTYTLTASIPVTDNTEAAEAVLTVTISPKAVTPTITITPDSYKYTGSAIHPSGSAVKVMDGDTVIPDSEYTLSYGENTQVGNGSVTVTDKENGNYTIAQTTETFTITKADQATLTITGAPGSVTYGDTFQLSVSGGSGTGAVSWAASGATVDNAGNVTITRVGTVIITAAKAGDSNYYGTEGRITLNVSKKALAVSNVDTQNRQYDGTSTVKITGVTLDGIVNGDTVSVSTANLTGTLNGSNVGSYTAVTLPALTLTGGGADNYTLTRPAGAVSTSVTISKATARTPKTGDLAVANKQAHTYTYGLGALRPDLPAGMSFGSSAVTYELGAVSLGSYYDSSTNSAKIEGQTLTLPIEAVESNEAEGIGTITVTIHTGNFEDMTATINVRSVNKTIPTGAPTLSAATLTYGQPLSTIALQGDMAAGATPVPGKFEWSSPDNRPAVQEAYAAAWTFKPDDNDTYAIVTGTALIQVLPAPITGAVIVLDPAAFRYDGAAHRPSVSSVTLNGITLTADVDYTAGIPEGTEAGTYTVTITGKGNYTGTAAATFTINPVETGDEFKDESGTTLRLEVETGLSTVPEALKNNAKYDTPAKIEAELRTRVEQVMSNVGENIAVFDVTLQYKDASGTWHNVDPDHFPTEGVTAILPYPAGTGATGYTFTVQHLISSGTQAGTMETLSYTLTADGLQCKFLSLSPVAIGYQAAAKPVDPVNPNPGGGSGGGGGGVSTYAVTVEKSEHGKVTANRTNAGNGSTVTLTVTPDTGYVLDTLTVTDSRGNEIKLTALGNGKYTFTMPGRAVTVKAAFAPLPDGTACDGGEGCPSRGFTDLGSVGTWYHEAVDYVLRNNLMGGYGNGTFGPNDTLTRAQFAQILFNKEGKPVVNYLLQFTDVSGEAWYTEAVRWAASQGIVGGYADGRFGPNDNITREQLAVMLWRYAGSPAATDKELHFSDADKIGAYARDALCWAVENGVMNGRSGVLDPKGLATRAQTAQMLKNFFDK